MNMNELKEFESLFTFDENGRPIKFKGYSIGKYANCPKHGEYAESYRVKYGDGLWERTVCEDFKIPHGCLACLRQEVLEKSVGFQSIPLRYREKSLKNFVVETNEQSNALNVVSSFVDNAQQNLSLGKCLIFCGGVGTGKTHLTCALANELNAKGYTAIFTTVSRLIRSVRASWGTKEEQAVIDSFIEADLLIIDEVGVQAGSDNEKNILFDVINGRYEQMKSTIVISNLNVKNITEFLGERVVDRLRENGGTLVPMIGESYRKKN